VQFHKSRSTVQIERCLLRRKSGIPTASMHLPMLVIASASGHPACWQNVRMARFRFRCIRSLLVLTPPRNPDFPNDPSIRSVFRSALQVLRRSSLRGRGLDDEVHIPWLEQQVYCASFVSTPRRTQIYRQRSYTNEGDGSQTRHIHWNYLPMLFRRKPPLFLQALHSRY
jgi:hypothetical protein